MPTQPHKHLYDIDPFDPWTPSDDAVPPTPAIEASDPHNAYHTSHHDAEATEASRLTSVHRFSRRKGERGDPADAQQGALTSILGLYTARPSSASTRRRREKSEEAGFRDDESVYEVDLSQDEKHNGQGRVKPDRNAEDYYAEYEEEEAILRKAKESRAKLKTRNKALASRRRSITVHVASVLERQNYILKLARALMTLGSPSHRINTQLEITARALELPAHFIHLPGVLVASFGDVDTHTSETHFVKCGGGLNLGKLPRCVKIYKEVVHDEISVTEGSQRLSSLLREPPIWKIYHRVIFTSIQAGLICVMGFKGSIVDGCICVLYGAFFGFMSLRFSGVSEIYSNIFEISMATVFSFISRALATTNVFCYQSLTSGGLVGLLPGLAILSGSLELASKNLINGSVRMVYAIIYSLFLGFGIVIGSDFYLLLDSNAREQIREINAVTHSQVSLTGIFSNGTSSELPDIWGTFTVADSASIAGAATSLVSLQKGQITCYRQPEWEWWRQSALVSPWMLFGLVPVYTFFQSLQNGQPIKDWQLLVQVVISSCGFFANFLAERYIFAGSDIVSFVGAFTVATMGNVYARIFHRTAFTSMATGVMFLLPGGLAAAGGLSMSYTSTLGGQNYAGITLALRMVQTAVGITVGLFTSSFVINSVGLKGTGAFTF